MSETVYIETSIILS